MLSQKLTPHQAFPKIRQYCAYQERCHSEVKNKLYEYGLSTADVDELLSKLVEENLLNEERFAIQFAGGKFRIKQWGRVKIRYELRQKQVSDYCVKKALAALNEDDYLHSLQRLAEQKLQTLKTEKNIFVKKRKLMDHLRAKGYEPDLVNDWLKRV